MRQLRFDNPNVLPVEWDNRFDTELLEPLTLIPGEADSVTRARKKLADTLHKEMGPKRQQQLHAQQAGASTYHTQLTLGAINRKPPVVRQLNEGVKETEKKIL